VTLYATKDRPWSTVDPADAQPCSHTCSQHLPAPYDGPKLTLAELDERARAIGYSPGPGITVRQEWLAGRQAEVPAYLLGGAVERRQAVERFDPSPTATAARARRLWIDIASRLPEGVGPDALIDVNPEVASLASLIASLDVLDAAGLEELMGR
jgi:hypothetical protein